MSDVTRIMVTVFVVLLGGACGDSAVPSAEVDVDTVDARPGSDVADTIAVDAGPADTAIADTRPAPVGAFTPAPVAARADFHSFFTEDRVHPIEVRISQAEWDGLIADLLAYEAVDGLMRNGNYRRATLVFTAPDSTTETVEDIGIRTRGNTTRVVPQDEDGDFHRAHFKLRFNLDDRDRRFRGLRALNLKWADDEDDPTKVRERFSYRLFEGAGLRVPRTTAVALTLTIEGAPIYFGVYTALENVDKSFLSKRYNSPGDDGQLYKCLWVNEGPATLEPVTNPNAIGVKDWETNYRPAYDLKTNEATGDHSALRAFIDTLNTLDGEALATWLDANFAVESWLRMLAMNVLVGMPDDYWAMGNNYYLYFPEDGRPIEVFPYDYDHGLGGGWGGDPIWSHAEIATADIHAWKNLNAAFLNRPVRHPLADKVLAIPRYRERYDALLAAFIDPANGLFDHARYAAFAAAQETLYAPHLDNDVDEGESMGDLDDIVATYFAAKITSVRAQLGLPEPR